MKIVSIYEPKKAITAKLIHEVAGSSIKEVFFAPVLFIAVTEDGKLVPCVGGKANGRNDTDVVVAVDENYVEMTVQY
jgi:hypothetical protein